MNIQTINQGGGEPPTLPIIPWQNLNQILEVDILTVYLDYSKMSVGGDVHFSLVGRSTDHT